MSMATETKDGRWKICYRIPDRKNPITEYFGHGEQGKKDAETRELEIKLAKKKGHIVRGQSGVYLDQLAQLYLDDAKTRGASEKWRAEFSDRLNKQILPNLCHKPVDRLEYADILAMASEAWGGKTTSTIQRYLGYVRAVFRFGIRYGITTANPMAAWSKKKEPKLDVKLTVEDLGRIIRQAPPHLAWTLEVEWELGTRPGVTELFSLRWDDVDFEAGNVHVRGSKTRESNRIVPITPDFRLRLLEMKGRAQTPFIIKYDGQPLKSVKRSLRTAVRRAGVTYNVRPYDVRHLFATVMLTGGADLAAVSALLGHATINTTQASYYHLLKGEKERAVTLRPSLSPKRVGKLVRIHE